MYNVTEDPNSPNNVLMSGIKNCVDLANYKTTDEEYWILNDTYTK